MAPEKPFTVASGDVLRIRIVHDSELAKAALGHFRLSITTDTNPLKVVEIDARLRPLLDIPWEQRPKTSTPEPVGEGDEGTPAPKAQPDTPGQAAYEKDLLFLRWREVAPELAPMRREIASLKKQIEGLGLAPTFVLSDNLAVKHPTTQLRVRGVFTDRAEEVPAAVPGFLGALPSNGPQNRLGLAQWVVGPENPLTARVRMNQVWEMVFGQGIVETSEDFGTQGSRPSHPELLDWLATEFVSSGWNQKAMYRLDRHVEHVSSGFDRDARVAQPRSFKCAARARPTLPGGGRNRPRHRAVGERSAERENGRPGGVSAAAGRDLVVPGIPGHRSLCRKQGRGPVPPGPLHLHPADRALPEPDGVRRAVARNDARSGGPDRIRRCRL